MGEDTRKTIRTLTLVIFTGIVFIAVVFLFAAARIASKRVNLQVRNAFEGALKNADSVRLIRPNKKEQQIVFETNDSNIINELSDNIKLARFGAEDRCACLGDVKFEFYKQGRLDVEFTFHHQRKIRWREFHKDIKLKKESAEFLVGWILHNVKDKEVHERFEWPLKKERIP